MYRKILVPIDLTRVENLTKALQTAADLSKQYDIPLCYVSVTASTPTAVAHSPAEFGQKLHQFAADQAAQHQIKTTAMPLTSHDPAVDLDATLLKAIDESEADLVVMASHVPGLPEHLFASNAGYIASHAKVSVVVVR